LKGALEDLGQGRDSSSDTSEVIMGTDDGMFEDVTVLVYFEWVSTEQFVLDSTVFVFVFVDTLD